jgi:NAD(P)-dependent dehydrogenase (short-subunit alcohol dehydrogenase family)
MQIKFHTALITGSSRGLGRQIALKLAAEGVKKIAIHYRTGRSDAETTLSLIEAAGASGVLVQGDVADPVAAENLKEAAQKLGGCDIFVQSVCPPLDEIYEHVLATELSLEKWQLAFDTGIAFRSQVLCTEGFPAGRKHLKAAPHTQSSFHVIKKNCCRLAGTSGDISNHHTLLRI